VEYDRLERESHRRDSWLDRNGHQPAAMGHSTERSAAIPGAELPIEATDPGVLRPQRRRSTTNDRGGDRRAHVPELDLPFRRRNGLHGATNGSDAFFRHEPPDPSPRYSDCVLP